jgi:hypothetical protein
MRMERKVVRAGIAAAALLVALALIPSAPVTAAGKPIRPSASKNEQGSTATLAFLASMAF